MLLLAAIVTLLYGGRQSVAQSPDVERIVQAYSYPESELVDCNASQDSFHLPELISDYFQLICTQYGHVLTAKGEWIWTAVGSNKPIFFPAAPKRSLENVGATFKAIEAVRETVTPSFPVDLGLPPEIAKSEIFNRAFFLALSEQRKVIIVTATNSEGNGFKFAILDFRDPIKFGFVTPMQGSTADIALLNAAELLKYSKAK